MNPKANKALVPIRFALGTVLSLDFNMDRRTKRRVAIILLFVALGAIAFAMFFTPVWGAYVEYWLNSVVAPLGILSLPPWLALPLATLNVMLLPYLLGGVLGLLAMPFIRLKEQDITSEYLGDIASSLSKLKSASAHFQELALTVESQTATVERLKTDIESLRELKDEDEKKLKSKLRLVRGVSIPLLVLSHLAVFVLGVATSVAGNYVTDFLKAAGKWPY